MACAQASLLLNKMERALLSRPSRFTPGAAPVSQVRRLRCTTRAEAQPAESSTVALQQGSQKSSAVAQSPRPNFLDYWDPFNISTRSLRQMMSAMDRIFGEISTPSLDSAYLRAPWDIMEDDNSYQMRIDLPGFDKDEVKVHIDDGTLIVNAHHNKESSDQENKWSTRTRGSYRTRFTLPKNIETTKVVAKLNNGVLEIHLPKSKTQGQAMDVKIE